MLKCISKNNIYNISINKTRAVQSLNPSFDSAGDIKAEDLAANPAQEKE